MKLDSVIFYTHDIPRVVDFYTNKLGFALEYQQDDKYASFAFDNGVHLGIKKSVEEREVPGHQTLFIGVNDIAATYSEVTSRGIKIYKEITEYSWGTEFSILDPDGNKVLFTQPKT